MMLRFLLLLLALLLFHSAASAEGPVQLRIMTFNIWYGGEQVDFDSIIRAIKAADADIVALQEPDGNTRKIAQQAGYAYVDVRRHLMSRYPLFDSGIGERTEDGNPPYSIAGVGDNAVHAWVMVAPGRVIAMANTHLTSNPYGPELVRDGKVLDEVLANENEIRLPEAEALANGLKPLAAAGIPVFLSGDFNGPSHLDWTEAVAKVRPEVKFPVAWPVSKLLADAGFADSFRQAHPDAVAVPGLTWTPGYPHPYLRDDETHDRIDFIYAANARTVASVLVGEAGNPSVSMPITPWPSDHRSVVSTFEVTPVEAPALIAVEPAPVVAGQSFLIRVNSPGHAVWSAIVVPRGGDPAKDHLTGVQDVHPGDRPTIKLSTIGLGVGRYDAVMLDESGKELNRNRFSIIAADAKAAISIERDTLTPGSDIVATWSGAPGFRFDWVGVYRKHEPSVYNYLGFVYTGAKHEGKMTIPAASLSEALEPGEYELRLMFDDHYEVLAVAPFTIAGP